MIKKLLTFVLVISLFTSLTIPVRGSGEIPDVSQSARTVSSPINVSEDLIYPSEEYFFQGPRSDELSKDILGRLNLSTDLGVRIDYDSLFSMNRSMKQYLKNGTIDDRIVEEFRDNDVSINDDAKVYTTNENSTWQVVDGEKEYRIEDNGTALNTSRMEKDYPSYPDHDYKNDEGVKIGLKYDESNNYHICDDENENEITSVFVSNISAPQHSSMQLKGDMEEQALQIADRFGDSDSLEPIVYEKEESVLTGDEEKLDTFYSVALVNKSWRLTDRKTMGGGMNFVDLPPKPRVEEIPDLQTSFKAIFDKDKDLIGIILFPWYDLQDVEKVENQILRKQAYKAAKSAFDYFGVSDVTNETLGKIDGVSYRHDGSTDSIVLTASFDLPNYRFKYLSWQDDKGFDNQDNYWQNNGSEGDHCDNEVVKDDSYMIESSFNIYIRNGTIIDGRIVQNQVEGSDNGMLVGTAGLHVFMIGLLVSVALVYKFKDGMS
ncbi:MAG: hypothetical protein KGY66_06725 [Candidatus Thermoplasmatota archaeon]|nr:hypothetical protein [Candidatus Thermoplasmatota archaeon]